MATKNLHEATDDLFDADLDDIEAEINGMVDGDNTTDNKDTEPDMADDAKLTAEPVEEVTPAHAPAPACPSTDAEPVDTKPKADAEASKENQQPADNMASDKGTTAAPATTKPTIPMKRKALHVAKASNANTNSGDGSGGSASGGSAAVPPAKAAPSAPEASSTPAAQPSEETPLQAAATPPGEGAGASAGERAKAMPEPEEICDAQPKVQAEAEDRGDWQEDTEEEAKPATTSKEEGITKASKASAAKSEDPTQSAPAAAVPKRRGLTAPKPKDGSAAATKAASAATKPKAATPAAAPANTVGASTEEAGEKLPTAKSAYMFFAEEMRPKLKAEDSSLSMPKIAERIGGLWRDMNDEAKAPYQAQAETSKKEVAAKLAEMGEERIKAIKERMKAERAAKKEKKQGGGSAGVVPAAVAEGSAGGKKRQAKAAKPATLEGNDEAANDDDDPASEVPPDAPKPAKRRRATVAPRRRGRKAAAGAAAQLEAEGDEEDGAEGSGDQGAEESDESDREDVEWDQHPADGIFALGPRDKFLVRRRGVDLTKYGAVDSRAAKRLRMGSGSMEEPSSALPLGLPELEEFEAFQEGFWREVRDHTQGDSLELDDLPEGSALEMVYVLGKLREEGGPLCSKTAARKMAKGSRKDFRISVPALSLSMHVQRIVNLERRRADQAEAAAKEQEATTRQLKARVQELEAQLAPEKL